MLGVLFAALFALPVTPLDELGRSIMYDVIAIAALAVGWAALVVRRPARRAGWVLLLLGYTLWVAGDLVWDIELYVLESEAYPALSDVFYLSGYGCMVAGVQRFARSRLRERDWTALLDAAIVAAGVTVPAVVFVIVPAALDAELSTLGKVVTSAYPIGDILVLAVVVRLIAATGARSWSSLAVAGSMLAVFVADVWNTMAYVDLIPVSVATEMLWLGGYVLLAAALLHPSMLDLSEGPPTREQLPSTRRLALLTLGSLLPAGTLFLAGAIGQDIPWVVVSIGGAVLTGLVVARMAGLLEQVRQQAIQLAALARRDELTGAPNRRTWDHELSRACAAARDDDRPLCVAILDLDSFKSFNDRFGHPAGDRLLREAVAAWTEVLADDGLLARYGGEEFTVLLPGMEVTGASHCIEKLRLVTPGGQTFSAGIARWEPGTEPSEAVLAADIALYEAKRSGRDRIEVAGAPSIELLPAFLRAVQVALQPIVDPATGRVRGHEALARFPHDDDVVAVFEQAHRDGLGDLLEATTVVAAIQLPGRPAGTDLFVNVSGPALRSERFWALLPVDLSGVVVELLEDRGSVDWHALRTRLDTLLARGARLAVDDLGAASGDLARLLTIRPHVVKIDHAVVSGCATDPTRMRLVEAVVDLAHAGGAVVCAEGIEDADDLAALTAIGVDLVQGFLLGHPSSLWATEAHVPIVSPAG